MHSRNLVVLMIAFTSLLGPVPAGSYLGGGEGNPAGAKGAGRDKPGLITEKEAGRILDERKETISRLLAIAKDEDVRGPKKSESRIRAVKLLGQLRATEAVGYLVKNITICPPCFGVQTMYPAKTALVRIGAPSIRAILRQLGDKATARQLRLWLSTIELIDRNDRLTLQRLEQARARARRQPDNDVMIGNLDKMVKMLKEEMLTPEKIIEQLSKPATDHHIRLMARSFRSMYGSCEEALGKLKQTLKQAERAGNAVQKKNLERMMKAVGELKGSSEVEQAE